MNSLRANGGRVIAYVSTVYGTRPIADVKADILKYKQQYSLDGIFLDEMTNNNNAANLTYYKDIYAYIKSLDPNYRVTGNPGTNTQPAYITGPAADTLVTFESSNTDYGPTGVAPSAWTASYATRRFSTLVYDAPTSAAMQTAVANAVTRRAGYVYVTDDGQKDVNGDLTNPWDTLPTYWAAELSAVRALTPTWASAASGDWNATSNWTTPTVPNAVGAEALLFGAISSAQTVYTNTPLTLGSLVFNNANRYVLSGAGSLTIDASVEGGLIDVRRGNHTINLPLTLKDTTNVYVADTASLTIADPLTIQTGAALNKTGNGTLSITSIVTDENAPVSVMAGVLELGGASSVDSLTIEAGATLAFGSGASLSIADDSQPSLRAALLSARGTGDWSGSGITAVGVDGRHGVGYAATADGSISIHLAENGDANLDGTVNFADLLAVAKGHGKTLNAIWSQGDFDYDGIVGENDLSLLQANYAAGSASFGEDWKLAQSLVPEPGTLSLLGVCAAAIVRRRR